MEKFNIKSCRTVNERKYDISKIQSKDKNEIKGKADL